MTKHRYSRCSHVAPLTHTFDRRDYGRLPHQQGRQLVWRLQQRAQRLPDLCHLDLGFIGAGGYRRLALPLLRVLRQPITVDDWWRFNVELPADD